MKKIVSIGLVIILTWLCSFIGIKNAVAVAVITNFNRQGSSVTATVAAWSEPEGIPNPCYGWQTCMVGPDVSYSRHGIGSLVGSCLAGGCIEARNLKTTADVARQYTYMRQLPFTYTFSIDHPEDDAACAGMVYIDRPVIQAGVHGELFPGATCTAIPPDNFRCTLDIPPYIDHGTLSAREVNGSSASVNGKVSCNYDGQFSISTISDSGDNIVHLKDNSVISAVTINGQNATNGLVIKTMRSRPTNIKVNSVLTSDGTVTSGNYKGNIVIYVNYS
ncbi:hypothetical protein [uncultured Pluralibacter sp.]|uniref:MrpH family fimbial adhesin n=1 Tax=uncultured Pluralibacter sp. TaxID=1490864 RepID=UPI00263682C2|nr:hypothetical protein [uncultured Pluralibacter sp.]